MSRISDVVDVVISRENLKISSVGFGTTCLLIETTALDSRISAFSETGELLEDDRFGTGCLAYLAAAQHLSQDFKPKQFKIGVKGRADKDCKQRVVFNAAATGGTFALTVKGETTAAIAFDAVAADIKAALELLNCVTTATVVVNTASKDFTITLDSQKAFPKIIVDYSLATGVTSYVTYFGTQIGWPSVITGSETITISVTVNGVTKTTANIVAPLSVATILAAVSALSNVGRGNMQVVEETASQQYMLVPKNDLYGATVSIAATASVQSAATVDSWFQGQKNETYAEAILACVAEDSDFLVFTTPGLHSHSDYASQTGLSDYAESATYKLYGAKTSDPLTYGAYDASSPLDIGAYAAANSFDRTFVVFQSAVKALTEFPATAITGRQLSLIPGSSTWKFKELSGCTVENLTTSQINNILARNVNFYDTYGNEKSFREGTVASGEFIDVIIGIDYLSSGMGSYVFAKVKASEKVPITDAGAAVVESLMRAALKFYGSDADIIDKNSIVITLTPVAQLNPLMRAARTYNGAKFSARLNGAMHKISIAGYLYI